MAISAALYQEEGGQGRDGLKFTTAVHAIQTLGCCLDKENLEEYISFLLLL